MLNRLLNLFSTRNARILCLVIAILNRSLMVYHYSEFVNYDEKAQLSYSFNLIRGHGLSETRFYSSNPDLPIYDYTQIWPPGYSLAIAPLLILFNDNEFLATTTLDILMSVLIIFLILSLCNHLSVSPGVTNIIILVAGCFQYYIFTQSYPTDHPALASLLAGFILCIKILCRKKKLSFAGYLFTSIVFFLPFFFKYMYLPATILFPVTLVFFSYVNKNSWLRFNGLILLLGAILLSAAMLTWTKLYGGNIFYLVPTEKGWFPGQLLHWYPFIPSAFVNIESIASIISKLTTSPYLFVIRFLELINLIALLILCYLFIRKNPLKKYPDAIKFFFSSGIILSAAIIFLLGYLTLTNKPQHIWNYNIDGRYFVLPVIILQLSFLIKYSFDRLLLKDTFSKFIYTILLITLLLEAGHGIFSTIKNVAASAENPFPTNRYLSYERMANKFEEVRKKYPDRDILLTSPNEYYLFAANNANFKPIYDFDSINSKKPFVTKKSVLVTVINDDDLPYMSKYISERKPRKFAYDSFVSFFAEEIDP